MDANTNIALEVIQKNCELIFDKSRLECEILILKNEIAYLKARLAELKDTKCESR